MGTVDIRLSEVTMAEWALGVNSSHWRVIVPAMAIEINTAETCLLKVSGFAGSDATWCSFSLHSSQRLSLLWSLLWIHALSFCLQVLPSSARDGDYTASFSHRNSTNMQLCEVPHYKDGPVS